MTFRRSAHIASRQPLMAAVVGVALATASLGPAVGMTNSADQPSTSTVTAPRLINADPGAGGVGVVKIQKRVGDMYSGCSAYLWRPRILITAAHCVSRDLSHELADEVRFLPAGTDTSEQSTEQQWTAGLPVQTVFRPAQFFSDRMGVSRDVALMVVPDPQTVDTQRRLVTPMELAQAALTNDSRGRPSMAVGYGPTVLNGPMSDEPQAALGAFDGFYPVPDVNEGKFFANLGNASGGPGDSGSPVLLAGDNGGFAYPIAAGSGSGTQGFSPLGWLSMVNQALDMVGAPQIPGSPGAPQVEKRKKRLTVTWTPPVNGSEWVAGYQVLDQNLQVLCSTTKTSCSVKGAPQPGDVMFVRATNADGEGSSSAATILAEPRQMQQPYPAPNFSATEPFVRIRLLGPPSATGVTKYEIQDERKKRVCRITQPESAFGRAGDGDADYGHCYVKFSNQAKQFRVRAKNKSGWSQWSRWSAPIRP